MSNKMSHKAGANNMELAQQLLGQAVTQHQQGNIQEAEKLYRTILQKSPDFFDALHLLGVTQFQLGNTSEALEWFKKAGKIYDKHPTLFFNQGVALHSLGQFQEALQSYEKALNLKPEYWEAYCKRGFTLQALKRYDEAVSDYEKVLEKNSQQIEALSGLASVLLDLNKPEEALALCDKGLTSRPDIGLFSNRGNALQALDRYQEAILSYDCALEINQMQSDVWFNRGNAWRELKEYEKAIENYQKSLAIKPDFIGALYNCAQAYLALERTEEAQSLLEKVLKQDPNYVGALVSQGILWQQDKKYRLAMENYDKVLSTTPTHQVAGLNRAHALCQLKEYEAALVAYDLLLSHHPGVAEAYFGKGVVFQAQKLTQLALQSYTRAIEIDSKYIDALLNQGNVLQELKRYSEALGNYEKIITLSPKKAEAYLGLGRVFWEMGRKKEALASYEKAIEVDPKNPGAYVNRGNIYHFLKRNADALRDYEKALEIDSEKIEALLSQANVYHDMLNYEKSLASYARALELDPKYEYLFGNWLHAKTKICDWNHIDEEIMEFKERVQSNELMTPTFVTLALLTDATAQREYAKKYCTKQNPLNPILGEPAWPYRHEKIKIGYFSADYHNHATTYLMAELFENQDRTQFEWIAFSFGPPVNDAMRLRVLKAFDQFYDVYDKTEQEIAALARQLEIDIAIDLKGYTTDARTNIFAYRAAPIQVNYLGYPGTMGAEYIDYIIADEVVIPKSLQAFYTEKVAYLPYTYQPNDQKRAVSERIFSRTELGLPENGFVFCCFNNNYKILPETFRVWMRLLQRVEGSVLWLLGDNLASSENLKKAAKAAGIASNRIIFAERILLPDHLARHRLADLFLDTWPYNAHTTASDALWMGVPVLTYQGETFASRVAASLLHAVGLPELVTHSQEAYEELAYTLATNKEQLMCYKNRLAENRLVKPLFQGDKMAKHLEQIYQEMMRRYQAGLLPDEIHITV